jgi:DNA ligase-1
MSNYEIFLAGRKYLLSNNVIYTIRDRESDEDYDPDEEWTFEAWCGPAASQDVQDAYQNILCPPEIFEVDVPKPVAPLPPQTMSGTHTFPPLYGESSHGKRKVWSIRVEARGSTGVLINEHGYEDGKKVVNERVVEKGKNIGKSNETTPFQQAVNEAQSAWNKKRDAGYKPECTDCSETAAVDTDKATKAPATIPLPMLAHDYNKRGKSIVFPCYVQAKLDGVRCVAVADTKTLYSRNGKAFPHLQHIRAELARLPAGTVLDGELYSDALTFQEIVGLVKKETLRGDDAAKLEKIYLCVYDVIVADKTNTERNVLLENLLDIDGPSPFQHLRLLPTRKCVNRDEVKAFHADFVAAGYEGLMLRNCAGLYRVGVRSTELQKYKEFEDAEYKVVGYKEGDGLEKGCVIWMCETPKGQVFAVRPRGTHEARAALMKDADRYVGQQLTVRFQELTTDGIPRFPVGLAFRDYE